MRLMAVCALAVLVAAGCGGTEMKDFNLVLIREMDEFPELDNWEQVPAGSYDVETAAATKALMKDYADLEDLVRTKSVIALSDLAKEEMANYSGPPKLENLKLTAVSFSGEEGQVLFAGVWDELPSATEGQWRRLMIYPVWDFKAGKVDHIVVTLRNGSL
jgi:hypothetical protein